METLQVYTVTYMGVLLWVLGYLKSSEDTMSLRYLNMSVTGFHTGRSPSRQIYCALKKMNGAGKNCIVSFIRFTLMGYLTLLTRAPLKNRICLNFSAVYLPVLWTVYTVSIQVFTPELWRFDMEPVTRRVWIRLSWKTIRIAKLF